MTDLNDLPAQSREITAPEGCAFVEEVLLPVRMHLACVACERPMPVVDVQPVTSLVLGPAPKQGQPTRLNYIHQCPGCGKRATMPVHFPVDVLKPRDEVLAQLAALADEVE